MKNSIESKLHNEFDDFVLDHDHDYFLPFFSKLNEFSSLEKKRVLDFGCGSGGLSFEAAKIAEFVYGIDISKTAIASATQKALNIENIEFMCINVLDLKDDISVNSIVSHSTLQYIPNPAVVLKKLYELLDVGGEIIMTIEKKSILNPISIIQWFNFYLLPSFLKSKLYYVIKLAMTLKLLPEFKESDEILKSKSRYLCIPVQNRFNSKKIKNMFNKVGFKKLFLMDNFKLHMLSAPHYFIYAKK